jgi:hypothetical protein
LEEGLTRLLNALVSDKPWIDSGADSVSVSGYYFDQDVAAPGTVELAKENTLPRPQHQSAVFNEQHTRITYQAGFDMRRRVPLGMAVVFVLRRDGIKLRGNVRHNSGVGVLIDQNAGGGVGHKDVTNAVFYAAATDDITDFPGDVPELYSRIGFNIDFRNQIASMGVNLFSILYLESNAGNRQSRQCIILI